MKMKKFIAVLAAASMVAAMAAGCGSKEDTKAEVTQRQKKAARQAAGTQRT